MKNFNCLKKISLTIAFTCMSILGCSVVRVSTGSGNFFTPATWSPAGVPGAADNLTIAVGHTVTISGAHGFINNLVINGNLTFGDLAAIRVLNVFGTTQINAGGVFDVDPNSNFNHLVKFFGDVNNDGTYNGSVDANSRLITYFLKTASHQIYSGTGSNSFYLIDVRNGAKTISTRFTCSNFAVSATAFLSLTSGTAEFSMAQAGSFQLFSAGYTIGTTSGLIINSPSATFTCPGTVYVNGDLIVQTGTLSVTGSLSIGNASSAISGTLNQSGGTINATFNLDLSRGTSTISGGTCNISNNLILTSSLSMTNGTLNAGSSANRGILFNGGTFTLTNGVVNVSGYIGRNSSTAVTNFVVNGGTITVNTVGMTTSGLAPFNILTAGSTFTMTNGTMTIRRSGASNRGIELTGLSGNNITGGTIILGDASTPAATSMLITTPVPLYNLTINSANLTATVLTNALTVSNDVNIIAGTLNGGSLSNTVGGNWTNTGNAFVGSTSTMTFNKAGAQTITRVAGENFNHLVLSGGVKTLGGPIASAQNITINAGATLDVSASNHAVSLKGNWVNDGTFTSPAGTLTFNGSVAQTMNSSVSTDYFGLAFSNSAGTTIQTGTHNITDALTVSAGTLNNSGGTVTLVSDATKTARIAQVGATGAFSGTFIVQQHISARGANYHDLSSPVASTTIFDWDDEMFMSGLSATDNPVGIAGDDGDAGGFQSIAVWDEPNVTWAYFSSNTDNLAVGVGYNTWFGDDPTNWNAKTIDTRGTPNRGNVTIPVQNTGDGNNLVGNPFASSILWSGTTRTNIDANFYMLDNSGNYQTYGLADEIPPHQGFFVYSSSGTPALTIPETSKTTTTATNFHRTKSSDNIIVKLSSPLTSFYQEVKLNFNDNATLNYDKDFDGYFIKSPNKNAPALTIAVDNNKEMIMNVMPSYQDEISLPLRTKGELEGVYSLEVNNLALASAYSCVMLEDNLTGKTIDLKSQNNYSFDLKKSDNPNRFVLRFSKDAAACDQKSTSPAEYFSPDMVTVINNLSNAAVKFNFDETTRVVLKVYDMQGKLVNSNTNLEVKNDTHSIDLSAEPNGVYMIVLDFNGKSITKKVNVNH